MTAADVRLVVQVTLEHSGASPQIVSDNGSQFTAGEFKQLMRLFELEHVRIRIYHPESNGRLERFHRSTREELAEQELTTLTIARDLTGRWVEHYNTERLHASLQYLPPAEYYAGEPEARIQELKEKFEEARKRHVQLNRKRRKHERATA